jgi:seryl-tRNA synthetase
MLDIRLFRTEQGGNPEVIRESQRRRYADVGVVDRVIALDERWRQTQFQVDALRRELNESSKRVGALIKSGEDASAIVARVAEVKRDIPALEREATALEQERDLLLREIGNLVHDSVPVSANEEDNRVERYWGYPALAEERTERARWTHVDLLLMLGAADYERGAHTAGSRGYYLLGVGVRLNLALIQYALTFLRQRGYRELQPPYFMMREAMARCAQLADFDEQLYKVTEHPSRRAGSDSQNRTNADNPAAGTADEDGYYLIATSEQPICAFHQDEWIDPATLPLLYAGFSTCFRKEAGAHGRDQLGIFRVHQFEKIEQFAVTSPLEGCSWEIMERMLLNCEEFYQSLGIPYRIVTIVSGALNNAAAKKYDLEAWYPASRAWRELVSCSNCTDYQARRLQTRFGMKKAGEREKKFVHMLNSTLCATSRVICCLVENYQREDGVEVPAVLQSFLGGDSFLPFVNAPPKDARPVRPA